MEKARYTWKGRLRKYFPASGRFRLKLYKLPLIIHEPCEDTENKYMAEIPLLPGCRAWGDTAAEVLENLQSVAAGFIESHRTSGDPLPPGVEAASSEPVGSQIPGEMLVAI